MSEGLVVGLGLGFGLLVLVATCGLWLKKRGQSSHNEEKSREAEIWTTSFKKPKKEKKRRGEEVKITQRTNWYEEDYSYNTCELVDPDHQNDKKKKTGKKKSKAIDSEEEEYMYSIGEENNSRDQLDIIKNGKKVKESEKITRNRLESEGDYTYDIGEEEGDYGDGYAGHVDIRSSLAARKPKPVLQRESTEETYENDPEPELEHQNFKIKEQVTEDDYTYENY